MRTRLIALLVPLLVLAMGVVGTAAAAPGGGGGQRVDVIVVLHDGADARDAAHDAHRNHDADVSFVYEHALQGFAASVPPGRLHALERDARVDYVERDREVSIHAQTTPTGIQRIFADDNSTIGIDGVDERVDVDVAVVDTGIDLEHPDLNVAGGVDCTVSSGGGPPWARTYYCSATEGTGGDDDHYHGTHVAGTIGAIDDGNGVVGVAPGARLWAVKVLDSSGSGYTSGIVAGIDWIVARGDIEVLNMSLGGSGSCNEGSAYDDAIDAAVANGVAVAVSAGNSGADANNYSPASCDNAFTVSALADFDGAPGGLDPTGCRTDQDDTFADFSNWGSAVDITAPGVCILSTYPIEQGGYGTISGTSMSSPHVAGALALVASSAPNGASKGATAVSTLYADVKAAGNLNWDNRDDGDSSKERLLDVSNTTLFNAKLVAGSGGGTTGNTAPTATIDTPSCVDLTCSFTGSVSDPDSDDTHTYSWDFGDGKTATGASTSHTYTASGTYQVTLTVSDGTASDTDVTSVTVSAATAGGFSLSTSGYKVKGRHHVDLSWDGATSTNVDVYIGGGLHTTTANDGAYTWSSNVTGSATYTFRVCEAGTTTCSNESTVVV